MAARQAPPSLGFSRQHSGVGCHFLLQCMKVKSESKVAQSCLTVSDPTDCSPPDSPVPGILQARILEWVAIFFSKAFMHAKSLQSCPTLCNPINGSPPGSPLPGILQEEHWSGLPFPYPMHKNEKWSHSVVSTLRDPMDRSLPGSSIHGIFQARVLEWGANLLLILDD